MHSRSPEGRKFADINQRDISEIGTMHPWGKLPPPCAHKNQNNTLQHEINCITNSIRFPAIILPTSMLKCSRHMVCSLNFTTSDSTFTS